MTRSSYCESSACVEVQIYDKFVDVNHSGNPAKRLTFTPDEWRAFIKGAKDGEFDLDPE